MHIVADTLDDLMRECMAEIIKNGIAVTPSKGPTRELFGVLLELKNPRARLSRTESKGTLFSCLGELFWYLSGSDELDFIQYYIADYRKFSDDKKTLNGAYGKRFYNHRQTYNQIGRVITLLKDKPNTRQAVIQIFDAHDLVITTEDVPCTCTLQFAVRSERLNLVTTMRSNDVYKGLPHDIFAFTMLQELVARALDIEVGWYKHFVSSMHIYDESMPQVNSYLEEGWTDNIPMPPMPSGDQWPVVQKVLGFENSIRKSGVIDTEALTIDEYWKDILRILCIFNLYKERNESDYNDAERIRRNLRWKGFDQYVLKMNAKIKKANEARTPKVDEAANSRTA